ncbi:MAG: hypothetical protein EOM80_14330 [Erysipelotrichia bacterium]|nr:hypothetical protein [Erysipelotrichia bacterium]
MKKEKILCVPRVDLPLAWLPDSDALELSWSRFIECSALMKPLFIDRSDAEHDCDYKQVIPYILLLDESERLAVYSRNGSEKRLNGCLSIAVGGHLRADDFTDPALPWPELAAKALQRELSEELPGFIPAYPAEFLGLINEEKTAVGLVHIGLVFVFTGVNADNIFPGEELKNLTWVRQCDLFSEPVQQFELWSELALKLLQKRNPNRVSK